MLHAGVCLVISEGRDEFPNLKGKVLENLHIFRHPLDGTEIHIDFSDGTSFSCCVTTTQKTQASLLRCGGAGEPQVLKHLLDEPQG